MPLSNADIIEFKRLLGEILNELKRLNDCKCGTDKQVQQGVPYVWPEEGGTAVPGTHEVW